MTIYRPEPVITDDTRLLLRAIDELILKGVPKDEFLVNIERRVEFTKEELDMFIYLLERKDFGDKYLRSLLLIPGILYSRDKSAIRKLREIFQKGTEEERGFRNTDWMRWPEYLARLGIYRSPNTKTQVMSKQHFFQMEEALFNQLPCSPYSRRAFMKVVQEIDLGPSDFPNHGLGNEPYERKIDGLLYEIRKIREGNEADVTVRRLCGLATLISNTTVLFTTRDWSVTGTISAGVGAIGMTLG